MIQIIIIEKKLMIVNSNSKVKIVYKIISNFQSGSSQSNLVSRSLKTSFHTIQLFFCRIKRSLFYILTKLVS